MGDERDNVKLGAFDGSDLKEYVKGQCEIMEDAGRHIEMIMEEYSQVSERFADIELYENAPDNLKDQIAKQAELVDNLAVDRRILKNSESSCLIMHITEWTCMHRNFLRVLGLYSSRKHIMRQ